MPRPPAQPKTPGIATPPPPRRRPFRRFLLGTLLLLLLALTLLLVPAVFRRVLPSAIALEAWRHGVSVRIGAVEGSLFAPVVLHHSAWAYRSEAGSQTEVQVERAEATFSWRDFWPEEESRWFQRLRLEKVKVVVRIPPLGAGPRRPKAEDPTRPFWLPAPARLEAVEADLLFQSGADSCRLQETRLLLSELEPGTLEVGQLTVQQPWLKRSFRNVHGITALQEERVLLADLSLEPGVRIASFSAEARELVRGHLKLEMAIEAFGGRLKGQAETVPEARGSEIAASYQLENIALAPLATFLGLSEAAGGTVRDGKVTFRGSLHDLAGAAVTVRVDASNFQWETRQWDSLRCGATLLNHRIQIPELELRQGANLLSLNGETALPTPAQAWWQTDFNLSLAARIENLTELSALLLPEFRYTAGKVRVDGAVRSRNQQYSGTLIASGSELTWRSAPIQELRAALRLEGRELQVTTLDLQNREDYLHGQGAVSVDGASTYRGELRASIEDLAPYAALLQKPLVPEPLAGGGVLRWSGEGSPAGAQGSFFARLRRLRPLRPAPATALHPVDAELEGRYAPAHLEFSRFELADEACAFHAQVEVEAQALRLREIRLNQGTHLWLAGEALLPLELRPFSPEGPRLAWIENAPLAVRLQAEQLSLAEAARLSGWAWPVAGLLTGQVEAQGRLGALQTSGHLVLKEGRWPLEAAGRQLLRAEAELALHEQKLSGTASWSTGSAGTGTPGAEAALDRLSAGYTAEGVLDFASWGAPVLQARVANPWQTVRLWPELLWSARPEGGALLPGALRAKVGLELTAEGPLPAPTLRGTVQVFQIHGSGRPELAPLWKGSSLPALPPCLLLPGLLARCPLDLACEFPPNAGRQTAEGGSAGDEPGFFFSLHLGGTGAAPALSGEVKLLSLPAVAGALPLLLEHSTITFRPGSPGDPTLDLQAKGTLEHLPVAGYVVGPLSGHLGFFDSEAARAAALSEHPLTPAIPADFPGWATFSHEAAAPPTP